jgi:hypothetical protein
MKTTIYRLKVGASSSFSFEILTEKISFPFLDRMLKGTATKVSLFPEKFFRDKKATFPSKGSISKSSAFAIFSTWGD